MKLFRTLERFFSEPIKELGFVLNSGVALVLRREGILIGWLGKATAFQEDGGAMTRRADEASEGLMNAPHAGEAVAFVEGGLAVVGGMGFNAGFADAIDLGQGGTDHDGGVHTPAEGVDAFGITGTEDEEEGVLGEEGGFDKGFLFGKFEAARLNGSTCLGFEGFKVGTDVFGVLIGTEEDGNGNAGAVGDTGGHGAGGGFKMEVAVFEAGIDAGINCDAVGLLAPGGVAFHHLQGLGKHSAALGEFRVGGEGGRHEDFSGEGLEAFGNFRSGVEAFRAKGSGHGRPGKVGVRRFGKGAGEVANAVGEFEGKGRGGGVIEPCFAKASGEIFTEVEGGVLFVCG